MKIICFHASLACLLLLALPVHAAPLEANGNVNYRGSLLNSLSRFEKEKKGHVAFIGGSITEMNGYRPMVCEILRKRFPETQFSFTDAGISSTCSTTGAFRLKSDVLDKGPVDLFFVEFAVNDDQDAAHARRDCIRGMEGIVRHARADNPNADIVITYFVNPGMMETIGGSGVPISIAGHDEVARHYGISTINLAKEVTQRIADGKLTWKKFGGVHPAPFGNAICTGMIDQLLSAAWRKPSEADAAGKPHPVPPKPLDEQSYFNGRFVDPAIANILSGWKLHVPKWKELPGNCRGRFLETPMLCTTKPGAELKLEFNGRAVGAYLLAGPDVGTVEASVDGGPSRSIDLYHRYSRGLHYPRTVMFAADLAPGKHVLTLRVAVDRNAASSGHAVRIIQFTAN